MRRSLALLFCCLIISCPRTALPQVALVRQLLERRLPQLEAAQQWRAQQAGLAGGGSSSCAALALPGERDDRAVERECEAGQAAIQVATVDSFQASCV